MLDSVLLECAVVKKMSDSAYPECVFVKKYQIEHGWNES
jgi:hypothetical protein